MRFFVDVFLRWDLMEGGEILTTEDGVVHG